jgi:2-iminobutanoate/2-iminopropanoate deaminase
LERHVRLIPSSHEVYDRYFPARPAGVDFPHVPSWPGPLDVEIDCVAVI